MFRSLLISAALAGLAPAANAGDIQIRFGYDSHSGIRVGVGLREGSAYRHRHPVSHAARVWVPGRIERVAYQVWVPARTERVLVPSRYETRRLPCGRYERVLVVRRHYVTRVIPGHYETRYKTIQHPGCWEFRTRVHVRSGHGHRHGHAHGHRHGSRRGIETLRRDRRDDRRDDRRVERRGDRREDRRDGRRDGRRRTH